MTRITMRILRIKNFIKDKGLRIKDLFHYFVDSAVRGSEEPSGSRRDRFVGLDRPVGSERLSISDYRLPVTDRRV